MKYEVWHKHITKDCSCKWHEGKYKIGVIYDLNTAHDQLSRYERQYGGCGWFFWVEEIE